MVRTTIGAVTISLLSTFALAQEYGPAIVPERLQELAAELPIAERLDFSWEEASAYEIGQYMGVLAAVNEVAKVIAFRNEREIPGDNDYQAALAVFCFWPNKPPVAEPYWDQTVAAFYDQDVRATIQDAVGQLAFSLPDHILVGNAQAQISGTWPVEAPRYFDEVFNFGALPAAR